MKRFEVKRAALVALAALFLALAWIWDGFIALGRLVVRLIPWKRLKQAFVAFVDRLPTPVVLLIFLVPLAIVEPLLALCVVAIAMGYVVLGVVAWIALKVLGLGLIAVIFDLTKHKLLTVRWFAWCYAKVVVFNAYAHGLIAPYQAAARALVSGARARARAALSRLPGFEAAAAHLRTFRAMRRPAASGERAS